jgi:hypothetical protein
MENQERLIEQLREENQALRGRLKDLDAEKEAYRKALQKLLPLEEFEYDEAELKDLLANPHKYQTLDQFIRQLKSEFA